MQYGLHADALKWAATLAILAALSPAVGHADFELPPPPAPTMYATHAGATVANFPGEQTIDGAALNVVDTSWSIEANWINNDVPSERAVWAIFRGTKDGGLDGSPTAGTNYALTHHALTGNATTTLNAAFNLPVFGNPDTPSGTYTIIVAELSEAYYIYDPEIQDYTGERSYTDGDFVSWFAGTDDGLNPPINYRIIEFEYVAGEAEIPCTENCFSNVLFLPGVKASRLYKPRPSDCILNCEDQLWEPNADSDVQDLFLNPDGTSIRDDIYTRDILDAHLAVPLLGNGDVYGTFKEFMDDEVETGVINAWKDIPYDWRLSLDDILGKGTQTGDRISYLTATDTPYIIQELQHLAETSKSGKVTIVAHSNGGLVAKALMNKLEETGEEDLVDKIIFVGVPQTGTPKAIAVLLHGYGEALLQGLITKSSTARKLAENLPAAYNLLPSDKYFAGVATPSVKFSNDATSGGGLHAAYGGSIESYARLREFLLGLEGRSKPAADDTDAPNVLNYDLLTQAEALHAELDDWEPPDGVELYEVAGVGLPTPAGITYVDSCRFCLLNDPHLIYKPEMVVEGDGTVIRASAHAGVGEKYYFNILNYNLGHKEVAHASLMGASDVDALINRIVKGETATSLPSAITTTAPFFGNTKHLVYRVHSPVSLDLYDSNGNHTGIATTTLSDGTVVSYVENNVPGTYYDQFGEVQYIFSDGSTQADVVLNGQGSGGATFDIEEMLGNTSVTSTTFVNIPVEPQTVISMSMAAGGSISDASNLEVDTDGDGEVDTELPAGGTVMYEDFIADGEEDPATPSPQPQSGSGGGGGGRNNPVVITVIATSTATSTPEAIITTVATSSLEAATTSPQMKQPVLAVKKTAAAPQKQPVIEKQKDATTNNVRLLAGAAASLNNVAIATSGKDSSLVRGSWWHRAYQTARNIIHFIIGL